MKFTVVGVFVPLVVDEFAIVWGSVGVKVERARDLRRWPVLVLQRYREDEVRAAIAEI